MPLRAICDGFSALISAPLKRIFPELGSKNFVNKLKQVVFPAPLGPIRACIAPRSIAKFTLFTAMKPLNDFVRSSVSRMTFCLPKLPRLSKKISGKA